MGPPIVGQALAHALEHVPSPAFLISRRGRVVIANRIGTAWLAADLAHAQMLARSGGPDPGRFAVTAFATHYLAVLRSTPVLILSRWSLTPREAEVVGSLMRGATNLQIAAELGCAKKTVEHHMSNILRKVDVENRAGLILALLGA